MDLPKEWHTENCGLRISNNVITVSLRTVRHCPAEAQFDLNDDEEGHFHFNLPLLSRQLAPYGGQYNPRRFAAIIRNFHNPSAAVLLFAPGKMVCTGARTINQAELVLSRQLADLHELGYKNLDFREGSFEVQNIVGSAKLPGKIDLDQLAAQNPADCMYTPDLFPGAALRPRELDRMTVLVFPSGCVVATGGKSREDLERAITITMPLIYRCRVREKIKRPRNSATSTTTTTMVGEQQQPPVKNRRRIGRQAACKDDNKSEKKGKPQTPTTTTTEEEQPSVKKRRRIERQTACKDDNNSEEKGKPQAR